MDEMVTTYFLDNVILEAKAIKGYIQDMPIDEKNFVLEKIADEVSHLIADTSKVVEYLGEDVPYNTTEIIASSRNILEKVTGYDTTDELFDGVIDDMPNEEEDEE